MIACLAFSFVALALVSLAGQKDPARDPRLTILLILLLIALPILPFFLPKLEILPATSTPISQENTSWPLTLKTIWLAGSLLFLAHLLIAAIGLSRWHPQSTLIKKIGKIELRQLPHLRSPVAAGIFRKSIFVPATWQSWPRENQEIVLAHELAHHRRRDPLWRLCIELARIIHWYHPGVHWLARRFILQSEFACDEQVIHRGLNPRTYAETLCNLAEGQHSPLALAMANTSSLEQRISRMFSGKSRSSTWLIAALGLTAITTACAFSMISQKNDARVLDTELRWSANPFPGEQ